MPDRINALAVRLASSNRPQTCSVRLFLGVALCLAVTGTVRRRVGSDRWTL